MEIGARCLYSPSPSLSLSFSLFSFSFSRFLFSAGWTQAHPLKVSQMISNITMKLSRRWNSSIRVRSATHFSSCFSYRVVSERRKLLARRYSVLQGKWGNGAADTIPISESNHVCMQRYKYPLSHDLILYCQ